jgi:methyl-accepting chemotaxis protein
MNDQAAAATQVTSDIDNIRKQAEQGERALADQARAMKELTGASINTARQIKLISAANREHSSVSGNLLGQLETIRRITDQNVRSARDTRGGTAELARQASTLAGSLGVRKSGAGRPRTANGKR